MQGYRTESEMTELLSNISNDIREDGTLDGQTLGSALINHAIVLDTVAIRNNLSRRYSEIGVTANIPSFGKYISTFISKTKFEVTQSLITYPETGDYGDNILSLSKTAFGAGSNHSVSLAAHLSKGTALKIKIISMSADTTSTAPSDTSKVTTPARKAGWFFAASFGVNWTISAFDETNYTQTFTAIDPDKSCDLMMYFDPGSFKIEYYEMNSSTPTRTKTITCQ